MNTEKNITFLRDYQPSAFSIEHVYLTFDLDPEKTRVKSELQIKRLSPQQDLFLQGEQLELVSVRMNDKTVEYIKEPHGLRVSNVPDTFSLEIITEICPKENTALTGLYISNHIFCTQCEAEYFRKITYYLDRPDVMALFTVKIIADKREYPVLLSNGNRIESGDLENGRHYVVWQDPHKKPCYLFALVAGDLSYITDQFVTMSGKNVALYIYSEKQNIDRCAFAMSALKRCMRWDEKTYGREYDLDIFNIVAVNDFIFGAMENKSLNIFNAKYILANEKTATDQDYADIDTVVAHEYFHNWSGDRVTCRDWFQLSLKEGFTIFREQSYDEDQHSAVVHRIRKVQDLRNAQFAEDAGPMAHPVRPASYMAIDNFYTRTVYNKGGEVVRMLKTILGADTYRQATDRYFEKFDGQAVTTDDFVDVMEEVSRRDLSQFRLWYSQAGTPRVHVTRDYDHEKRQLTLTIEQHIPSTPDMADKQPMMIPITTALIQKTGETNTYPVLLEKQQQVFFFNNVDADTVPSLNRHFSAPIKLDMTYTEEELLFLFQQDTDGFNRWEAGQRLACNIIFDDIPPKSYLDILSTILHNEDMDHSFQTELLSLPSEKYLHEENRGMINPLDISSRRRQLFLNIARELEPILLNKYLALSSPDHAYSPLAMGRRRLRALCLSYLVALEKPDYMALAFQQFQSAKNMTDSVAALTALSHTDTLERVEALAKFYDDWQHEPLAMNKWFAIQAQSTLTSTLNSVQRLMQQPFFNLKNPNNVYALIGGFCGQNSRHFHEISGNGYQFCADCVITLDSFNPMVAARMVEPLLGWRRFVPSHGELMQKALIKILQKNDLSKNVYEPVSKALGEQ
ncbi:MAG: aminopeptidase N [Gammaproteobacteria bacterium]|nr:aminopeptidase N [Gammaproteobacteria bacterium]MCD8543161.1 aminopeptidase N [Gammaproteobacteria bacterium]